MQGMSGLDVRHGLMQALVDPSPGPDPDPGPYPGPTLPWPEPWYIPMQALVDAMEAEDTQVRAHEPEAPQHEARATKAHPNWLPQLPASPVVAQLNLQGLDSQAARVRVTAPAGPSERLPREVSRQAQEAPRQAQELEAGGQAGRDGEPDREPDGEPEGLSTTQASCMAWMASCMAYMAWRGWCGWCTWHHAWRA